MSWKSAQTLTTPTHADADADADARRLPNPSSLVFASFSPLDMPWFQCNSCGDSIKKPKLKAHFNQCAAESFSCIDCSETFDRRSVAGHVSCVTEHEKYALAATKPGQEGILAASKARNANGETGGGAGGGGSSGAFGEELLSTRPPWKCSCFNVSCTSVETLERQIDALARNVSSLVPSCTPSVCSSCFCKCQC